MNTTISIEAKNKCAEGWDCALMISNMYKTWAKNNGYTVETISLSPGSNGVDEELLSTDAPLDLLKKEAGFHEFVRISPFGTATKRNISRVKVGVSGEFISEDVRRYIFHPYEMVKDMRDESCTDDLAGVLNGKLDFLRRNYDA